MFVQNLLPASMADTQIPITAIDVAVRRDSEGLCAIGPRPESETAELWTSKLGTRFKQSALLDQKRVIITSK